ncbi:hypothetical protein EKO27_g2196 [Xylaria grammica]|uniref:25S rRNA (uridine-N(3))-methyltransferase BMT5-like domain-containing protein n=1 Tax=Xylaria grammica TaxID=363999 RepID=A0A439DES6_9PEZI|nr:hypothetical protein EKO27_g2196 [Xylaria grammica]
MGKKRKLVQGGACPNKLAKRPHPSGSAKKSAAPGAKPQQKQNANQQHAEPTIPFSPEDKILLVGDGDLSFAMSLVEHHYCADVTATVFEKNCKELLEKHPHASDNIAKIEAEEGCRVLYGIDATKMAPFISKPGRSKASGSEDVSAHSAKASGVMDRIIFNFPHVGGKSTDVNRQVRYNQELLVSFFQRAIPSLTPGGSIIVTLFEGEPYTLWNIRDLARHSGLQVERSFRFQASAYPGYHHARTLGVVRNRSGEVGGGWKGENRAARSYIFTKKDVEAQSGECHGTKRSREDDDESSDGE